MGQNQKTIKVSVEATGNEFTLAAGELMAKVRDVLLDRRRSDIAATTWAALSENDQEREVENYTDFAEELVTKIVEVVAAGNFDVIHAKLDNFKIKDGDVTVTAKGRASDGALLALNSVGVKALKIIVADEKQFDQHRDDVHIDKDQTQMFDDETEGGEDDDDDELVDPETGEITDRDDTTQAVIDAVEDDLNDERPVGKEHATAAGFNAYREHGNADQNPYSDGSEIDQALRAAWFNGFYRAKNAATDESIASEDGGPQDEIEPDPYDHGYEAAEKLLDRSSPYDDGSADDQDWLEGFDRAVERMAENDEPDEVKDEGANSEQ